LALLIAAGCCIGFNTFRYPVVREMAAAISPLGPSGAAKPGETPLSLPTDCGNGSAEESASGLPAGVVCKDGVCTMTPPDSPTASVPFFPPGDLSADPSNDTAEKAAWSAKPEFGYESTSKPADTADTKATPSGESVSEEFTADRHTNESARDAVMGEGATSAYEPSNPSAEGKTAAKLVSALAGVTSAFQEQFTRPAGEPSLVPIQRPKKRSKSAEASVDRPAPEAKSQAKIEAAPKPPRRLPAVDQFSSADSADPASPLHPDLVRTYPVTP
jgi:hypothetical protein